MQRNHSEQSPGRGTHRLERPEIPEIVEREVVEHLSSNRYADEEPEHDRDAEVDRDARFTHPVIERTHRIRI